MESMFLIFIFNVFVSLCICNIYRLPQCNKRGGIFSIVKEGFTISGDNILKQVKVSSIKMCVGKCITNKVCKSISFKNTKNTCFLHGVDMSDIDKDGSNMEFIEDSDMIYMQPNNEIQTSGLHACFTKPCHSGELCIDTCDARGYRCQCKQNATGHNCEYHNCLGGIIVGGEWSFVSINFPEYGLSYDSVEKSAKMAKPGTTNMVSFKWKIVPGLCGKGISFMSTVKPNYYLRVRDFLAYVDPLNDSDVYHKDACFILVPGKATCEQVNFQSVKYPDRYLRHQGFIIKLHQNDRSPLFQADSTFKMSK